MRAGLTGFGGDGEQLQRWLSELLGLGARAITLCNDIEIAYLDSFAPGEGYLVYAGTGSIGAWIDEHNQFHRAGGRGVMLDDGGGGFWIAREALRQIWRHEDECPGAWQQSPMARAVFDHVGGSDWSFSRQFIYGQERGEVGKLALAVAASADSRPGRRRHPARRRRGTGAAGAGAGRALRRRGRWCWPAAPPRCIRSSSTPCAPRCRPTPS